MSAASASGSPGQRSRCSELMSTLPLLTAILLGVNIGVYVLMNIGDFNAITMDFCVYAYAVVYEYQWYRIITSEFMHGGILHIAMNMMALYQFGVGLESMFGTLQYVFVMLIFMLFCGLLYIGISVAAVYIIGQQYWFMPAVGFSGVLFAMAVDEASLSPMPSRSVFGLFSVPTKLYPWVLMILLQLLIPNVSLIGHLAGVLTGFIHSYGGFRWLIPSVATLRKIEDAAWFARVKRLSSYKLLPTSPILREDMSIRSQLALACSCLGTLLQPLRDCFGRRQNAPLASRVDSRRDDDAGDVEIALPTRSAGSAYAPVPTAESADPTPVASPPTANDSQGNSASRSEMAARMAAAASARVAAQAGRGIQRKPDGDAASPTPSESSRSGPVVVDGVLYTRAANAPAGTSPRVP